METELQAQQPDLYASLTKSLTPEEQSTIQAAVNQAESTEAQLQAVAAGQVGEGAVNGAH